MKNSVLRAVCICILLVASPASLAGPQGWVTNAKVVSIVVVINGGINFRLSPELSGCTSQSGYGGAYASVYPDHPGRNQIHSVLLAAYMSDKPIAAYFSDTTCKVYEVELGGR